MVVSNKDTSLDFQELEHQIVEDEGITSMNFRAKIIKNLDDENLWTLFKRIQDFAMRYIRKFRSYVECLDFAMRNVHVRKKPQDFAMRYIQMFGLML